MQSRRQRFVIVFFTSWMTLSILKRGYPLEISRALASYEVANTMSRVFWEWSKMRDKFILPPPYLWDKI